VSKQTNVSKFNVKTLNAKTGKEEVETNISESQLEKLQKDADLAVEVTKRQTFRYSEAESLEEIPTLFEVQGGDPSEALNCFNRGYSLKQHNIVRDFMSDDDQPEVEGEFDLLVPAAAKTERKLADPRAKAAKLLGITVEDLNALLASRPVEATA